MERLVNTKIASKLTGYSEKRIRFFANEGMLPVHRVTPTAAMRFRVSEIAEFMNREFDSR